MYRIGEFSKMSKTTIKALRQLGLSIEEIKLINKGHSAEALLQKRKKELEAEIANASDQLSRIEFLLSGEEELSFMSYQAIIKELPECIVYSKRMTVPSYDAYFQGCLKPMPTLLSGLKKMDIQLLIAHVRTILTASGIKIAKTIALRSCRY